MAPPRRSALDIWTKIRQSSLERLANTYPQLTLHDLLFTSRGLAKVRNFLDSTSNVGSILERASLLEIVDDFKASKELLFEHYDSPAKTRLLWTIERREKWMKLKEKSLEEFDNQDWPAIEEEPEELKPFLEYYPRRSKIPKIPYSNLSSQEFFCRFAVPNQPVVISDSNLPQWTFAELRELIGPKSEVLPERQQKGTLEWAGMANNTELTHIDRMLRQLETTPGYPDQLFDVSIPDDDHLNAALADSIYIPRYFTNDFLKRVLLEEYAEMWPSLFCAAEGTGSALHIDGGCTHFWMGVVRGAKLFRLFAPESTASFAPKYAFDANVVFSDNALELGSSSPLHWAFLEPGDIIFVPSGWLHKVDNLAATIAISGNFVDRSNLEAAIDSARFEAVIDPEAYELAEALEKLRRNGGDFIEFEETDIPMMPQNRKPRKNLFND